jgi:hypothetical protein
MKQTEAAKLKVCLQRWRALNPYRWRQGAQIVANDLMQEAAFVDIKVAGFLEAPDGAAIAQVVQNVLPFPGDAEAAVMIEAIKIAAKEQTTRQVIGTVLVGALCVIILGTLFGE